MNFDSKTAADYAKLKLQSLLERTERDSAAVIDSADIPTIVKHFAEFRDTVRELKELVSALQGHVDTLSYETIPTIFQNQGVKNIRVDGVGMTTIVDRWSASMLNKPKAFDWLRANKGEGLIIETVNAQTLAAYAKQSVIDGNPLPPDIFRVSQAPLVSIGK